MQHGACPSNSVIFSASHEIRTSPLHCPIGLHGRAHGNLTAQLTGGNTCSQSPGKCFQCSFCSLSRRFRKERQITQTNDQGDPVWVSFPLLWKRGNARCKQEAPHSGCMLNLSAKHRLRCCASGSSQPTNWRMSSREEGEDMESN